jgi:NADH-ubiquinone oxidoreductase chain 6
MNNFLLDSMSLLAILSSVLVITSKNPVISVIFLISLFINTAIYLILLGIGFVGISYIIIYIGAITVLFLFVIMMIDIRLLDILELGNEYTKNLPLAILVGSLFTFEIFSIIPFTSNDVSFLNFAIDLIYYINEFLNNLNFGSIFLPFVNLLSDFPNFLVNNLTQIASLGRGLYTYGSMWLIVSSLILLLSMVAAIIISITEDESNSNKVL